MAIVVCMNKTTTIKQILKDNCPQFFAENKSGIPDYVKTSIEKMIYCRDPELAGFAKYACPDHPDQFRVVPFSCKQKCCNACSKINTDRWVLKQKENMPDCSYWHITLTVPCQLRQYFLLLPELRRIFLNVASDVVLSWFKERNILPAVICAFHSHGRDLKFHPHVHLIVSCGGLDSESKAFWVPVDFIPFDMLRSRWKTRFLLTLRKKLPSVPSDLIEDLFSIDWHINISNKRETAESTLKYIGKYAQRPVVSEKRILDYDKEFVTLKYFDFRSRSVVVWKLPVFKFISLLIQHIQIPGFVSVKGSGLLASRNLKLYSVVLVKIKMKKKKKVRARKILSWRERIVEFSGKDPLVCPVCGKEMVLTEFAFWHSFVDVSRNEKRIFKTLFVN